MERVPVRINGDGEADKKNKYQLSSLDGLGAPVPLLTTVSPG